MEGADGSGPGVAAADVEPLSFRILGPVEAEHDGRSVELGSRKVRALLALLLLHANELLSRDVLIEELWGGSPPPTAGHTLSVYVSRLRKALHDDDGGGALVTRPGGYLLRTDPERIDSHLFERLVAEGKQALGTGDVHGGLDKLQRALGLWHGAALANIAYEPFALVEARRLEELRLEALEARIEAELAEGGYEDLPAELTALVAEHPLRERLVRQLMLALYRAGRQVEALEVYRDARRRLVEELGIEPSEELQELQQHVLRHDPALDADVQATTDDEQQPPAPPRAASSRPHGWRLPLAGLAALLVVSALAVWALVLREGDRTATVVAGDAVALLDASTRSLVWSASLRAAPGEVALVDGEAWVTEPHAGLVARIDAGGSVRQEVRIGADAAGITAGGGAAWAVSPRSGTVSRIDLETGQVVQSVKVGNSPLAVAYGHGSVWVTNHGDQTVARIDAKTGRVVATIGSDAHGEGIGVGATGVWVSDAPGGKVVQIDPEANVVVRTVRVGKEPGAIAVAPGAVWVANALDGTISRIDPRDGTVRQTVSVGAEPVHLKVAREGVFVANASSATLALVDPAQGTIARTVELRGEPQGLDVRAGHVAVTTAAGGPLHRGGVLRIIASDDLVQSVDPATVSNPVEGRLASVTNAGLVALRREGGLAGTGIVPDLAVSLPTPTKRGTVYTFELRPNVRYSDGRVVRASDVRFSLERLFRARSVYSDRYSGIVGARRCLAKPAACELRRGIVTDDRNRIVIFRLAAPDPDFLAKLTLPYADVLPQGTPLPGARLRAVPATGPYRWTSLRSGRRLVLARNPRFREYAPAAHPSGYPDRIVFELVPDTQAALARSVRAVSRERADYIDLPVEVPRLFVTRPSRLHAWAVPSTSFLLLNTGIPPFDRPEARRALSFAIDRTTARADGQPTCQVLPPEFPSYRPYCPYTRNPGSGRWSAPDLVRARRLVLRSGTSGMQVTVWSPQFLGLRERTLRVADALRRLGYRTTVKVVPVPEYAALVYRPRSVQLIMFSWLADYPSPANFFTSIFSCGSTIISSFPCDRVVDRDIDDALETAVARPAAAAKLWARLDRLVVDRAPAVAISNSVTWTLVSRRVGNYKANPIYGPLLDQLWVR